MFLALWFNHIVFVRIYILTILGLAVLTAVYSFKVKNISKFERIIISLTGFLLVFRFLFKFTHWPGANPLLALMTIPVLLYIFIIFKNGFKQSKEFGFMLVWTVFTLTEMYRDYFFNYLVQVITKKLTIQQLNNITMYSCKKT